ncbi:hypothetical protein, partial [Flavobacterium anhuiense]|uniref:hypothetical protein n=1 Tax=Flavobacterium anhuiense TaxID=459526 RepID=UPI001A931F2E
ILIINLMGIFLFLENNIEAVWETRQLWGRRLSFKSFSICRAGFSAFWQVCFENLTAENLVDDSS